VIFTGAPPDQRQIVQGPFGCGGSSAAGGTPRTVLLGGEAGVGKSRLAGEFAARGAGPRAGVAGGSVELSTASLPYAPFGAALRELVRERGTAGSARPAHDHYWPRRPSIRSRNRSA
jgi:hypothetical protein